MRTLSRSARRRPAPCLVFTGCLPGRTCRGVRTARPCMTIIGLIRTTPIFSTTSPVSSAHAHLETHIAIASQSEDERIHVRSSSQAPFQAKAKLAYLFGIPLPQVHVYSERVGGGFGGKQEMLCEELCVLAMLKTGRPVKWE